MNGSSVLKLFSLFHKYFSITDFNYSQTHLIHTHYLWKVIYTAFLSVTWYMLYFLYVFYFEELLSYLLRATCLQNIFQKITFHL